MIVPSIDLVAGRAVQLIGGETEALSAGDPFPLARRFSIANDLAVIDLDAARGEGTNEELITRLVRNFPCRVGGGIRDVESARKWLDRGARQIILGTAATPEIFRQLPRARCLAAIDCRDGEVVVHGWRKRTGRMLADAIAQLREHVGGFLVTIVEREGRMSGINLNQVAQIKALAGDVPLTIAGGVRTTDDIRALDQMGIDAQVGMALYTEQFTLGDAIAAPLQATSRADLWPTVVCDEYGVCLGMAWSNRDSLNYAVDNMVGAYHSRRRGLWIKGQSSRNVQDLLRVDLDCDRDTLRFSVRQAGSGFCHNRTYTCWGDDRGVTRLWRRIRERTRWAPEESYTRRMLSDPPMLAGKLREEVDELIDAEDPESAIHEAADVLYLMMIKLAAEQCDLGDLSSELDRRELRVSRRGGDVKNRRGTER